MEAIERTFLEELSTLSVLMNSDWDAVADISLLYLLYCDATIRGFGPTFQQEQSDHLVHHIIFSAALPSSPSTPEPAQARGWQDRLEYQALAWIFVGYRLSQ